MVRRNSKVHYSASFLFLLVISSCGRLTEIRWSICISKSQRILFVWFSRTDSGLCIYHLFDWSNFIFCTIPRGSPSLLIRVLSHSLFTLTYWIHLCDWLFHLCHLITYVCYSLASYQFLPWYSWSLWYCSVLQSEKIQFLSKGFPFLTMSKFSWVKFPLLLEIFIQLFFFPFFCLGIIINSYCYCRCCSCCCYLYSLNSVYLIDNVYIIFS